MDLLTAAADVPRPLVAVLAGLLGLAVGSFLNVVAYRVPRDESVIRPPSACPHCGVAIAARDNVPVLGWLLLRGRARCCGRRISVRYPVVEAVTGVLFGAVGWWLGASWALPAMLYLVALSVVLTLIDVAVKRLPDVIVLPSYPVVAVLLAVATYGAAAGHGVDAGWPDLARAAVGGLALWVGYFALMLINPAGMGYGDVKLAGLLGMYLAWLGWGPLAVGCFAGPVLGGVYGILLIALGRAGRKSLIPFGPFMLAGAWVGVLFGTAVTDWYLTAMGVA